MLLGTPHVLIPYQRGKASGHSQSGQGNTECLVLIPYQRGKASGRNDFTDMGLDLGLNPLSAGKWFLRDTIL